MRHKKKLGVHQRVNFYCTPSGRVPFKKWFESLDPKWRARVYRRLERLEYYGELGNFRFLKAPGVFWEMRFKTGPGYRIYGGTIRGEEYIFLAGNKSTQKRDIQVARKYFLEVIRGVL